MMPIGPLMIEHRLIERVIRLLDNALGRMEKEAKADPAFLAMAVDFVRTYADRTHHGKEEDILFRDLDAKEMASEDRAIMDELVQDHLTARQAVRGLVAATERYARGDQAAIADIIANVRALVNLYPGHIAKEDKVFFPAAMRYLDRDEQDVMLSEMWDFDRKMIHEKYQSVVEGLEHQAGG